MKLFSVNDRVLWERQRGWLVGLVQQHRGWVRVFGWGVQWRSSLVRPVLFSERNGYTKFVHVGPWRLRWLGRGR